MYDNIEYFIQKSISPDKTNREDAQQYLEKAVANNLLEYLKALSDVLANTSTSPFVRMAAGLQLKNAVTSKDTAVREQLQQRWLSFPETLRQHVKTNVSESLGTETVRPTAASQCVAYIAVIELPRGLWPDIITILCNNVIDANSSESLKEASLESIGYICQDIDHDCLAPHSNNILTAIIHGMRKDVSNKDLKLAATTALLNSLEFVEANFEKEVERNYIMEVICETTQCPDIPTKVAGLQCLVKIMSLYYQYMEPYMGRALFPITLEAMKSEVDDVALQGIEFWSNVSDEEVDLAIEVSEAAELNETPSRTSKFYAKGALQYLVPILMQKLTQQEEHEDEDEWNPNKAASVCLMLLATCCEENILPHVIPFVKENIVNEDWRFREAALMAFGSVLGGLKPETLSGLVSTAMPTIIKLMFDRSIAVRDTAAWTIGRICEITPESVINDVHLEALLQAMLAGLKSEPRVASNVCWAFSGLAEASYEAAGSLERTDHPSTYRLSKYFNHIVEKLLETTNRDDAGQANLRSAAYEALMEMIKNSPQDCYTTVQRMTLIILERLNQVLQIESQLQNTNDRAQYNDLQGLLCATLQNVLRKVTSEDAPKISDQIMVALLHMFVSGSTQCGGVQEDALMAVTTLIQVLGEGFIKYMESFKPYLFIGLKNHEEYQVCLAAVGVVADLCRELKSSILPYCDEIMTQLLENLSNPSVHRTVKPQIISIFGDMALAIGPAFAKYLEVVLTMLTQAAQIPVDRNDFDMIEYMNDLRESIFNAYTGIVQGFDTSNNMLEANVLHVLEFIKTVGTDDDTSDDTLCACVGLIGDICSKFGAQIMRMLDYELMNAIALKAKRSKVSKTRSHGQWAMKELRRLAKMSSSCLKYVINYYQFE